MRQNIAEVSKQDAKLDPSDSDEKYTTYDRIFSKLKL